MLCESFSQHGAYLSGACCGRRWSVSKESSAAGEIWGCVPAGGSVRGRGVASVSSQLVAVFLLSAEHRDDPELIVTEASAAHGQQPACSWINNSAVGSHVNLRHRSNRCDMTCFLTIRRCKLNLNTAVGI